MDESETADIGKAIATAVLKQYEALPKNGKPQPNEHTVLAGFVVTHEELGMRQQQHTGTLSVPCPDTSTLQPDIGQASMHVVSIGTGTKCLGFSKRSTSGEVLNDSHAEVRLWCNMELSFHPLLRFTKCTSLLVGVSTQRFAFLQECCMNVFECRWLLGGLCCAGCIQKWRLCHQNLPKSLC